MLVKNQQAEVQCAEIGSHESLLPGNKVGIRGNHKVRELISDLALVLPGNKFHRVQTLLPLKVSASYSPCKCLHLLRTSYAQRIGQPLTFRDCPTNW